MVTKCCLTLALLAALAAAALAAPQPPCPACGPAPLPIGTVFTEVTPDATLIAPTAGPTPLVWPTINTTPVGGTP